MSYRAHWYAEHGLPYEPPRIGDCLPFRCVGYLVGDKLHQRVIAGELGPPQQRIREPGDDDEVIA